MLFLHFHSLAISYDATFFFFQAEDGIRDDLVTGVQTCALPISFLRQGKQNAGPTNASWVEFHFEHRSQTRRIMTSVDLTRAATRSPGLRRISLAASAVIMEVMCCSPMAKVICASRPLYLMAVNRPMGWVLPLILGKLPRREEGWLRLRDAGMRRSISDSGTRW